MWNRPSGISILSSSLKPTLQEMRMTHSLFQIPNKLQSKWKNTWNRLKKLTRLEAMVARAMTMIGILKKPKRIYCELTLLLYHLGIWSRLPKLLSDQENSFQLIGCSEIKHSTILTWPSSIKFRDSSLTGTLDWITWSEFWKNFIRKLELKKFG